MKVEGAKELDIELTEEQNEQLSLYLKELLEWNKNINLTSITAEDEIIIKHFLDSLTIAKAVDLSQISTLLDIGAGAGLPGIPLKIAFPHLNVTMVDSTRKKVNFMKHVIEMLKLENSKAVFSRSEDFPREMKESFDIVTSRAVAELRVLAEYCLPYVKIGGFFVAYKGADTENEIAAANNAISTLGGELERTVKLTLPNTDMIRNLVVIRKIGRAPDNFPRRAGIAKKRPL
ncbi:16S rRNA (guanine(527)-N(7))-methyltransferase RsmG [Candidatus Margulisiibacteriota bacterium]